MTYNIRKEFLGENSGFRNGQFNPALDEPTYLTFKLDFFSDEVKTNLSFLYDSLPQALFSVGSQAPAYADNRNTIDLWDPDLTNVDSFIASFSNKGIFTPDGFSTDRPYSALEYLYSRNEDYRCYLLAKFLKGWNDLQTKYQYYFQEIDGLDELFKSDPSKGQKIEKSHTITIKCLEGIDQKVKYLLSLYKAAAWDDHYQRWILPDIFRYFKLDIYISEIRTFHQSVYGQANVDPSGMQASSFFPNLYSDKGSVAQAIDRFAGKIVDKITGKVFTTLDKWTNGGIHSNIKEDNFVLGIIKGFVPVTCLRCSLCDFDINYNPYQSSYSINNDQMETTTIKVKVRQAEEIHNWRIIDPFRNLLNNTERQFGQKSLKSIVKIGDLADQYFNDTINLPEDDKAHYYTTSIGSGWIVSGIQKIADTVLNENNGVLDKVYDTYEAVRDAIAQKKSTNGNYNASDATKDRSLDDYARDFGTTVEKGTSKISKAIEAEDDNTFKTSRKEIKPYGSSTAVNAFNSIAANDPSVYSYLMALSHQFELDASFNGIVRTKSGSMIRPKTISDLSLSTDLDSSMGVDPNFSSNRNQMPRVSSNNVVSSAASQSTSSSGKMQRMPQDSKSLLDSIENGTLTYSELVDFMSETNRNLTIENEKSIEPLVKENNSFIKPMQFVGIDVPSSNERTIEFKDSGVMTDGDLFSSFNEDRSIATDLDKEKDILMTNLFSGKPIEAFVSSAIGISPIIDLTTMRVDSVANLQEDMILEGELVSIIADNKDFPLLNTIEVVEQPIQASTAVYEGTRDNVPLIEALISDDRSFATDFDNNAQMWERSALEAFIETTQNIDRSFATDLDSSIFWNDYQYKVIDILSKRHNQRDRSLATDLDNYIEDFKNLLPKYMIEQQDDRSLATDLDNYPETNGIEANSYSIKLAQEKFSKPLTEGEIRNTMTWVDQNTESMFNSIAELQNMPQETDNPTEPSIDTTLIDKGPSQNKLVEEDLFSKIADSMSVATSTSGHIEMPSLIENIKTSSIKEMTSINNDIDDVPVRELIKVILIDRSESEEKKIIDVRNIDNSQPKTTIL